VPYETCHRHRLPVTIDAKRRSNVGIELRDRLCAGIEHDSAAITDLADLLPSEKV
jgi:hypothetical protein